jgi:NAD(P)-dependent dehydrogenase (short-subunit alcohol dehydrogenase family)
VLAELNGKTVLVTGGASGIGEAVVRLCIEADASVVAVDLDGGGLEQLAESLDVGDRFSWQVVNVADEQAVREAVEFTRGTYDSIDGCFNNAGISGVPTPLPDTSLEEFDRIMRVNVYGMFNVLKHTMAVMRDQKSGSIVNTASTAGLGGIGNMSPYVASKYAAVGLTLTAGLEAGYYGVRVNAICPGWTWTPIQRWVGDDIYNDPAQAAAMQKQLAANVPLQRFAQPEEIARLALFLLSDESSYIAGETIRADGGLLSGYMS